MEIKETLLRTHEHTRAVEDVNYFKYIFKKTEKISCAVFYILRSEITVSHNDSVVDDLERSAQNVLDVSLESLRCTEATLGDMVHELRFALIELESKLRVAHAARHVGGELLAVFVHEIDTVHRGMKKYTDKSIQNPLMTTEVVGTSVEEKRVARVREVRQTHPQEENLSGGDSIPVAQRRDRIIGVLKDNPNATIKDICAVVTDCSEKTIQRELISMINDNVVVREGERRWSKYSLV